MRKPCWMVIAIGVLLPVAGQSAATSGGAAATTRRATDPITESYTWREDFQGAAFGQFASYPPVQDVGYDPSLEPTTGYEAPGGRALMRILKPVRSGPERFGFIRRLHLIASPSAVLSFSYRFEGPVSGDHIEIGIAGANGRRYTTTLPMGPAGMWHRTRLNLAELRNDSRASLPAGAGVDGLYIVAALGRADRDITYRFLVDDLSFPGAHEMRFEMEQPRAVLLEPRRDLFATAILRPGQSLRVEARSPVQLSRAECVVSNQGGKTIGHAPLYDDATHGDRAAHDGVWTNDALSIGFEEPGVYRLELNGTGTGGVLRTRVRIVRSAAAPTGHPRVYFDAKDRKKLIERSQNAKYAEMWREIVSHAQTSRNGGDLRRGAQILPMLDREYLLPTLPGYFDLISNAGARIQYNALLAYVAGDAEAREAARSAMLAVMQWKSWAPPWFAAHGQATYYPAGELTQRIAFAYDLLYDQLSPEERGTIRAGLLRHGIVPAYQEYVEDNRILADTSNWIAHSVASALVAAAAIEGEETDSHFDLYVNGLLDKLAEHLSATYLADGSYGEGISYHEFDLETLAPALVTMKRVFGLDYWGHSHAKDSLWYPISTLADPVSGCLDMGDSHCPSGRTIAPVVAHSNNPVFRWYEDRLKPSSIEEFLFADDTLPSKAPEAPGSRYFANKGAVVFRTGWRPDDAILLFRAGPNFNHNHAGQGGFLFRALGESLVTEAGYADYYKDPYYDSYFKQAAGHNTVLIDGDPASQEIADTLAFPALHRYPKITNVITSMEFDAVTSELQQVYRGRLKHFTRRLAFLKPDCLIVYDELAPTGRESFDWLLHLPDVSRIKTEPNTAVYRGDKASLAIRFLTPDALRLSITEGHLPYSMFNPKAPARVPLQPAILTARTQPSSGPVRILAALAPARSVEAANQIASHLRRVDEAGWTGVARNDEVLLFRQFAAPRTTAYDSWTTDADTWILRGTPDNPRLISALGVTSLKHGSDVWFQSTRPASFAARLDNGRITLNVYSVEAQTIQVRMPDGDTKKLEIKAGSTQLELAGTQRP